MDANGPERATAQLLLDDLEKSWRKYLIELKRYRDEYSNEVVHDLRIATRRLMALIQLLNSIMPRPRLQKIIRTLKEQLDDFDDLRDTQVILADVSETIQELPELKSFQKRQQRQEDKIYRKLRKKVKAFSTHELKTRIRKTHDCLEGEIDINLQKGILQAVDDAFMITSQRLGSVDLARPTTIHRVRIAFKTFRYMVETIHPLLQNFPEEKLKAMHDYQSLMGEVQDAEVFLQTLMDFSEDASLSDTETIQSHYEHRHAEAIAAYAEGINQLYAFWRPAPDQPFPWEKPK